MKKNSLLSLCAALLVVSASAASTENNSSVALPVYSVTATRGSAAEEKVNESLNALRAMANAPVAVSVELPALTAPLSIAHLVRLAARMAKL